MKTRHTGTFTLACNCIACFIHICRILMNFSGRLSYDDWLRKCKSLMTLIWMKEDLCFRLVKNIWRDSRTHTHTLTPYRKHVNIVHRCTVIRPTQPRRIQFPQQNISITCGSHHSWQKPNCYRILSTNYSNKIMIINNLGPGTWGWIEYI